MPDPIPLPKKRPDPLTPEKIRKLPFSMRSHINGGSSFSSMVYGNDEYGLRIETHTNGSPNYKTTVKELQVDSDPDIVVDLLSKDRDLEAFCKAYNERKGLS